MNGIPKKVTHNKKICFVKSGTPPLKRTTNKSGILFLANDWKIVADVKNIPFLFKLHSLHFDLTFNYTLHHSDMSLSLN